MVFEKIREMICDLLDLEDDEVTAELTFADDLDADSLDLYDLKVKIEDEFDIKIADTDVEDIATVGDLVDFVESQM